MAGREGVPNRNKQFLLKRLQDMYGDDFDPIIRAAESAAAMQKAAKELDAEDPEKRISAYRECVTAWDKVANYVTPKLKAVEHTGEEGGPILHDLQVVFIDGSQDS